MKYVPSFDSVEAVPVDLDGANLMALSDGQKAHIVSRDTFELMFRLVHEQAPQLVAAPACQALAPPVRKWEKLKRANQKRLAKAAAARPTVSRATKEFDAYPVVLRDPRADAQRRVYDALGQGPAPLTGLTERCKDAGWAAADTGMVMAALGKLREKRLAKKQDAMLGGDWTLV
jgi:hypothetical protein